MKAHPEDAPHHVTTIQEIDARGLEPPEPLMRILCALDTLQPGYTLRARTDREPRPLLAEAQLRGFHHECRAQTDGSWLTTLTRS